MDDRPQRKQDWGFRCWTEPARTRERAPVSAATEYDAAFRNDAVRLLSACRRQLSCIWS